MRRCFAPASAAQKSSEDDMKLFMKIIFKAQNWYIHPIINIRFIQTPIQV